MTSNAHHVQPFICRENDTSSLFSYLHAHKAQRAYREIRHTSADEILKKWPLLAEIHASEHLQD